MPFPPAMLRRRLLEVGGVEASCCLFASPSCEDQPYLQPVAVLAIPKAGSGKAGSVPLEEGDPIYAGLGPNPANTTKIVVTHSNGG